MAGYTWGVTPRVDDLMPMVSMLDKRLSSIASMMSDVGRLVHLKDVVFALPIFAMCYIRVPFSILDHFEYSGRCFLWSGNGINKHDMPWTQMIWNTYYRNGEVPSFHTKVGSFWWRGYCSILNDFKDMIVYKVACGDTIKLWYDKWDDEVLLVPWSSVTKTPHSVKDSTVEEKGGVRPGGDSEKLAKDSVPVKPNSTEGKKADAVSARRSNVGNASASHGHGAAASVEKSDRAKPAQAVNFSTEASGSVPVAGTKGESLHGGHAGEKGDSSAQGSYASQQAGQWEISNRSAKNNSGEAPANPNTKQDANVIQEAVRRKLDLARSSIAQCDVYDGSWVFDESYPLYASNSCPFVDQGFSCEANGRTEQKFDARKMLEMLRGKRLVFAGDSLNRNQWESMMCLLREAVSDPARIHETRGRKITKERGDYNFKFLDYNCTVEYHVTHFLVHEGKSRIGQKHARTLRIDTIDRSSSRWKGANVLVFNTAHWWSHHKTKAGLNYYQEGDTVHPHLDASTAFHRALTTWASWVDRYIDPRKTQVFFRSSSPSHFRIDGHPSVYGSKAGDLTASSTQDCSHWCLPGVPDTWNELLFYHLVSSHENGFTS
ncbi:hypothetical protein TRIUR3_17105 [Triticum urartu]|uniref:Trichome birefringence-like C-terminal domain-containing protein n=1 Tax=Triticum urartu TaxID=4572 RepID=M8AL97_TRIUA|nr:hypothetical protein TRIUR3_17105 [Triticum urartu]